MNVTLSTISLISIFNSPFLSESLLSKYSTFFITKSSFSNFKYPFLYFHPYQSKIKFSFCEFSYFLSNSISTTSYDPNNIQLQDIHINNYYFHESFCSSKLEINSCSFKNCKNRDSLGGSIFSICNTTINNSYFAYCFSYHGGGFCIFANSTVTNTQIYKCSSTYGGAIGSKFGILNIDTTSISFCCVSNNGGALSAFSNHAFIKNSNTSYCSSGESASAFDFVSVPVVLIYFNIFSFCASNKGGVCVKDAHFFSLQNVFFSKMTLNSQIEIPNAPLYPSSVYFDGRITPTIKILDSIFYECSIPIASKKKIRFPSIYINVYESDVDLVIDNCIFSNSQNDEIVTIIYDNLIDLNKNKFSVQKISGKFPKRQIFNPPYPIFPSLHLVKSALVIFRHVFLVITILIWAIGITCEVFYVMYKVIKKQQYDEKINE